MEKASVRLGAANWRPIVLCSMLVASKVWQDLASWNFEFAAVYPQFPLHSINKLETMFLTGMAWKLPINPQLYTKYYFALLYGMNQTSDFRRRYNMLVNVRPPNAARVHQRSQQAETMMLSKSL